MKCSSQRFKKAVCSFSVTGPFFHVLTHVRAPICAVNLGRQFEGDFYHFVSRRIRRFNVQASDHGDIQQSRGHGSMTKEETVQSIGPEIANGLQKVFIFIQGDNDRLSTSAMFSSCHKGIQVFATLLYHVIQFSGGLGQALKQSAQEFKLMP